MLLQTPNETTSAKIGTLLGQATNLQFQPVPYPRNVAGVWSDALDQLLCCGEVAASITEIHCIDTEYPGKDAQIFLVHLHAIAGNPQPSEMSLEQLECLLLVIVAMHLCNGHVGWQVPQAIDHRSQDLVDSLRGRIIGQDEDTIPRRIERTQLIKT